MMTPRLPILSATICAGLLVAPMLAFGQAAEPRAPQAAPATQAAPTSGTVQAPATVTIQVAPGVPTSSAGAATPTATTPPARAAMPTHAGPNLRTSQIVGSTIYNASGESIGSVDDLILGAAPAGTIAVLSVGTFLGMGGRLVTVPLSDLRYDMSQSRWVHDGATRQQLERLPAFTYARSN